MPPELLSALDASRSRGQRTLGGARVIVAAERFRSCARSIRMCSRSGIATAAAVASGTSVDARRGDRGAAAWTVDAAGSVDRARRSRRRSRSRHPTRTRRCWRSKSTASFCAGDSPRARPRSNGATGRCWRGSIDTRSTGCVPRSSRSRRPISCASCSAGSTSSHHAGSPDSKASERSSTSLDGYELGAAAWERHVLPARLDRYEPSMLDMLCLSGEAAWARLSPVIREGSDVPALVPATPIALFLREHAAAWRALRAQGAEPSLGESARTALSVLRAARRVFLRRPGLSLRARC